MSSDHHADEPVPFESNLTFSLLEQVLELRLRLRRRVVDLDLRRRRSSVGVICCLLGVKTTSLTSPAFDLPRSAAST